MKRVLFIIGSIAFIALTGCWHSYTSTPSPAIRANIEKISVVTTLFPLYDFAKHVGGDTVEVFLLLPPGVEAHTFEPRPSDIVKINQSDLFIYTGKYMEPWAEDVIQGISEKNVVIVDASAGISLMEAEEHEGEHEETDEHEHEHEGIDPHIWLDFDNAKIMVDTITQALEKADPENAILYQNNSTAYKKELMDLDMKYKNTLSQCESRKIVYGGHYAFGYMVQRYGLEYMAAQGFAPDSEPTAKDLIALVEHIKKNNIRYIFYEELSSPKIAETLAQETNASMLLLNGAHNLRKENYENNTTYLSLMESNLVNLSLGLGCGDNHNCKKYSVDNCPSDCVVCPPCAECSSVSCQTKEFCRSIGFDEQWYKNIQFKLNN